MSEEGRSSQAPPKKHFLSPVENFLLSGTAALISKTAAAPIERVKLMVQNQGEMLKSGALDRPYAGVMDCFSRIYKEEGVAPFWRGNLPNCLRYFPTQALNFMFKDIFKQMFKFDKKDTYWQKFYKNIMSGAAAGSISLVFVYSLDYCRTKLANDVKGAKKGGQREFNGMIDVYTKTWQTDGIVGLYRGFVISCVGIAIYRGFYFGLYDSLKPIIIGEKSSFLLDFSLGYTITVAAGLLSYPVDTIRRRMMMTSGQKVKYKGSIDCTVQILQKEGVKAMFHGAGANVLRGMAGAGVLSGFDKFKEVYVYLRFGNK